RKQDVINLLVLVLVATVIGVYLIATTVLISKDGILYIEWAKMFSSNPMSVVKGLSFGYPLLIFVVHKLATAFGADSSVFTWIYSAQSVTLLCRTLSLIPLYFIGKLLIGGRKSFWAILILIALPHPTRYGSSILREWPHILFLAVGFLSLLRGAKTGKQWMFGITGIASGLGHIIRPECVQLVFYGVSWILISLLAPRQNMNRRALLGALALLLLGFATPAAPYMAVKGKILPDKIKEYMDTYTLWESDRISEPETDGDNTTLAVSGLLGKTAKALGEVARELSDNLMHYFVPALVVGIYVRARKWSQVSRPERFFIPFFVFLNVAMMVLLHYRWGYMSRRHVLPLVLPAIFYVSLGLCVSARWLGGKFSRNREQSNWDSQRWFFILLAIGVCVCTPKLLGRLGADKQGYRDAGEWLRQNSQREDAIAVPDFRISFYAERKGIEYTTEVPEGVGYVVRIMRNEDEEMQFDGSGRKEFSARMEKRKKNNKRVVIYKII
ncbi:MAG: glycosyltransferase family 39 protein, partial [Planctomycetota bacterium]|nr:glycosyltransferase family 39 protein [Planctomycetota bacterium]